MNILITGGNGYIAKSLCNALKEEHDVTTISRKDFDLTDSEATKAFFQNKLFDAVIHCAVKGGSRLEADDSEVLDDNLKMYYNLLENRAHYDKFLHFGSGAEVCACDTPYGLSKHVIRQSVLNKARFYNLRIYGVFDENELDTRFIKANIIRYINKQPLQIHQDKIMSFFYMKDLVRLVEHYLVDPDPQKEIFCCYSTIYKLSGIADLINNLGPYKVEVVENIKEHGKAYYGENIFVPNIEYLGLKHGIQEVYDKLKHDLTNLLN
jgi:nucleoside-diphosphate-sugar epimerase